MVKMARAVGLLQQWETLAKAARFDSRELARLCGISVRQLQRDFRRSVGQTPQDWLNGRRIAAARQLLLSGMPVKVVALELGFKQTSHFCRRFKSLHRMTPTEFVSREKENVGAVARG